jgi:hypothetical protein
MGTNMTVGTESGRIGLNEGACFALATDSRYARLRAHHGSRSARPAGCCPRSTAPALHVRTVAGGDGIVARCLELDRRR